MNFTLSRNIDIRSNIFIEWIKNVLIKGSMTAQVVTIGEFETLKTAEFILLGKSIHYLSVVQDDILVGIISNTDV